MIVSKTPGRPRSHRAAACGSPPLQRARRCRCTSGSVSRPVDLPVRRVDSGLTPTRRRRAGRGHRVHFRRTFPRVQGGEPDLHAGRFSTGCRSTGCAAVVLHAHPASASRVTRMVSQRRPGPRRPRCHHSWNRGQAALAFDPMSIPGALAVPPPGLDDRIESRCSRWLGLGPLALSLSPGGSAGPGVGTRAAARGRPA